MFVSSIIIVLLIGGSFSPIRADDVFELDQDQADLEGQDLDEELQLGWNCSWYICCDLHQMMEMKKIMDTLDKRTMMYIVEKVRAIFPDIDVTDEEIFDDETWKQRGEEIGCGFSAEDREKLKQIPLLDEYFEEVCDENREDREECDKLALSVDDFSKLMEKYKEDCTKEKMDSMDSKLN